LIPLSLVVVANRARRVPAHSRGGQGGDARAVEDAGGRGASVIAGRAAAREREQERDHEGKGRRQRDWNRAIVKEERN
jgi:hypothetical protein